VPLDKIIMIFVHREDAMPYHSNRELPDRVRLHLPVHAQDIFREAFNHAYERYADPHKRHFGGGREAAAHRVAWAAVKRSYHKDGERWVPLNGG
jgi:cation transport regulator